MSTVIKVENLSKRYRLGVINRDMLYKDLQSRWAKFRGKEDPNAVIGLKHDQRLEHGDEFWALRNVDLEVKEGEILGIIGRNGAGKSTLLKILSQITAPTEGKIKVKGRIASLLEVGTGFHPELTGRENIYLNGAILGMTRKEVRSKFDEIVAFADISEFIDTPVKRYSSGMYVRLAFAVAAHLEPEILIIDEVLAVGDAEFQKKCLGKMQAVSEQGRTILFVSHNMTAIQSLCNRGIILQDGSVGFDGSAHEATTHYVRETQRRGFSLEANAGRGGSGLAKVTQVSCHADQRRRKVTFRIRAEVLPSVAASRDLSVALGINTEDGDRLLTYLSIWSGVNIRVDKNTIDVEISSESIPLIPGSYSLSVAILNRAETLDAVHECASFDLPPEPGVHVHREADWGFIAHDFNVRNIESSQ